MSLKVDQLTLRPATPEDAGRLLEWRNDPDTRAASVNESTVDWQVHIKWFEASLSSPTRRLLIAEEGMVPVGVLRFDTIGDVEELSWIVAPEARGRGIAKRMLKLAAEMARRRMIANIKETNTASQRAAAAAGFKLEFKQHGMQRWVIGAHVQC